MAKSITITFPSNTNLSEEERESYAENMIELNRALAEDCRDTIYSCQDELIALLCKAAGIVDDEMVEIINDPDAEYEANILLADS